MISETTEAALNFLPEGLKNCDIASILRIFYL